MEQLRVCRKNGEYRVESEEFKAAVGKFPTGVTVISTVYEQKFFGFTSNSFTSVSLVPSLISFCLDKKAGCFNAFIKAGSFAISILANDQEFLSKHFAFRLPNASSGTADKFTNIEYQIGTEECPLIIGAVCWLECIKHRHIECGDHFIFIGLVKKAKINNDKLPLIYFAKSYHGLK